MKNIDWTFGFSVKDNSILSELIQSISHKYSDGTVFLPHITFYSYTISDENEMNLIIRRINNEIRIFEIKLGEIKYSEKLSKTPFIEVEQNQKMSNAYQILEKRFGQNFEFNPHISLIYRSDLSMNIRKKLVQTIKYPTTMTVDSPILIDATDNNNSASNYRNWKTEVIKIN